MNSATGEVVFTPPPSFEVPILMGELVTWLNGFGEVHPILASGVAQFQLVHIYPFLDGNGRTSRLLSTGCLYRHGYDFKRLFTISEFYDRDRPRFYRAIQSVRERGMDLTSWLEFFAEGLATQLDEVKLRGERAIRADIIARRHGLNERQSCAIVRVLEAGRLTILDFEEISPGVARRTLQRDLAALVELGLLEPRGQELEAELARSESEFARLERDQTALRTHIAELQRRVIGMTSDSRAPEDGSPALAPAPAPVTPAEKIQLFRTLFREREDVALAGELAGALLLRRVPGDPLRRDRTAASQVASTSN